MAAVAPVFSLQVRNLNVPDRGSFAHCVVQAVLMWGNRNYREIIKDPLHPESRMGGSRLFAFKNNRCAKGNTGHLRESNTSTIYLLFLKC